MTQNWRLLSTRKAEAICRTHLPSLRWSRRSWQLSSLTETGSTLVRYFSTLFFCYEWKYVLTSKTNERYLSFTMEMCRMGWSDCEFFQEQLYIKKLSTCCSCNDINADHLCYFFQATYIWDTEGSLDFVEKPLPESAIWPECRLLVAVKTAATGSIAVKTKLLPTCVGWNKLGWLDQCEPRDLPNL